MTYRGFSMGVDGNCYWYDGDVTEGFPLTCLIPQDHEDYSLWTEERRSAARLEWSVRRAYWMDRDAAQRRWRDIIVESARQKLTKAHG